MVKRAGLIAVLLLCVSHAYAQKKNFTYHFYGQVRGDLFYNSRANGEIVDGLFHLYPKDHDFDADGNDLNAQANGSFYLLYSRLGLDLGGPSVGSFHTSAKLEADFRGTSTSFALLRIRHAYIQLSNERSSFLIGQTWHPFFGDVHPEMLNLSTGAPFNAFSRAPQFRYRHTLGEWQFTGTALWQLQYLSTGPAGKSESYMKNSCIPELHAGADYKQGGFRLGAGAQMLSLKPRTHNMVDGKTYKIDERITTLSFEAHAGYKTKDWSVSAKSTLGIWRDIDGWQDGGTTIHAVQDFYHLVECHPWTAVEARCFYRIPQKYGNRERYHSAIWDRPGCRAVGDCQCPIVVQFASLEMGHGVFPFNRLVWNCGQKGQDR